MTEFGELGTAMIHVRHVHGAKHPIGHIGRSWNLEKMPSSVQRHLVLSFLWLREPPEYHYSACLSPAPRAPSTHGKVGFLPRLDGLRTTTSRQFRAMEQLRHRSK